MSKLTNRIQNAIIDKGKKNKKTKKDKFLENKNNTGKKPDGEVVICMTKRKPVTFRPKPDVEYYMNDVLNKTEFVNRSLKFFINALKNPEALLKEMKMRNPELYKYVGRKQYD